MCCFSRHGGQQKQQTQALNVLGVANSQAETRQFVIFKLDNVWMVKGLTSSQWKVAVVILTNGKNSNSGRIEVRFLKKQAKLHKSNKNCTKPSFLNLWELPILQIMVLFESPET